MNQLIEVRNGNALLASETALQIANFERTMKDLKEKEDALKKAILDEMEAKGIIKVDMDELTITYIAPTDRETFDSKTFKKENPDEYDKYIRLTPVKSSIRIKVK